MKLHQSILRAYDIRGIVGETLSDIAANAIGKAFGSFVIKELKKPSPQIAVGYDGRLSSPALEEALLDGIISTGADAVCVGLGPTPMLYFSVRKYSFDAGIMVTGSHNPPTHNGFKMMIGKRSVYGDDIKTLGRMIADDDFIFGKGRISKKNVIDEYINTLKNAFDGANKGKKLKIAWDAGNGATGEVIVRLCEVLPGKHILLNEKIDGKFPAHHPDPTEPHNLVQLIDIVKKYGCDIGIAFDGDGDRVGAIDSKGRIIWGDQLMIFYASDVLAENPGATIIADVKASQTLFDEIKRMGGNPVMCKTGHSLVKARMVETGALIAGEMSGHIFFADKYYGYDDALYAAVRLLNLITRSDKNLDQMVDELPKTFNTPEIRIETTEGKKFRIIDEVKAKLKKSGANFNDTDGVRVIMDEGWWLLRASNTQAVLVARCEARNPKSLDMVKNNLRNYLKECGYETAAGQI